MIDYVELLANLDENPVLHEARLLLLLLAFAGDDNSGSIDGIAKLAKLDFLLRYPTLLKKALEVKGCSTKSFFVADNEMFSVESEMLRYRFGPWDCRYRLFLNVLVSEKLINISSADYKVVISLTEQGFCFAKELSKQPSLQIYSNRALILKRHFNLTSKNLTNFIYNTFPEIVSLDSGTRIII